MANFPATSLGWTEEFCSKTFGGVPILLAPANEQEHQENLDYLNALKDMKEKYDLGTSEPESNIETTEDQAPVSEKRKKTPHLTLVKE